MCWGWCWTWFCFLWKHEEVTFFGCFNHTNTLSGFQGENGWISRCFHGNLVVLHGNLDFPCSRLTCIENNPFWATPWWLMNENFLSPNVSSYANITLQGTNISPKNGILKMIFLFPRWDMLIPWRVSFFFFPWQSLLILSALSIVVGPLWISHIDVIANIKGKTRVPLGEDPISLFPKYLNIPYAYSRYMVVPNLGYSP